MLDELKQYIRSYVPGRLRLRHPGLKGIDADTEKLIVETVTSASGITGCMINPEVGSLLLTWDRHALTEEDLLGYLSFWAAFIPGDALGETTAETSAEDADETDEAAQPCSPVAAKIAEGKAAGKELAASAIANAKVYTDAGLDVLAPWIAPDQKNAARRRRVTQNRLMLAAGVGSVALLALRGSAHASMGWVFAAMALVHLYQHRTVL